MVRLRPGVPAKRMSRLSVQAIVTDVDAPRPRDGLLLANIEGADMDIAAIQTQNKVDLALFRQLPTLIKTFDEQQRKVFAESVADKFLGRKIADSEVNIVIDVLVDLAINYDPVDRYAAALRKRWCV